MTAINHDGQVYWTFEELNLEEEARAVQKEYDSLRYKLRLIPMSPERKKAVIARCSMLLDVRENLYKLLERGL
jgi:hypothetical protein